MTITERLEPYGPAICPRCRKAARIFVGRYRLICRQCDQILKAERSDD